MGPECTVFSVRLEKKMACNDTCKELSHMKHKGGWKWPLERDNEPFPFHMLQEIITGIRGQTTCSCCYKRDDT